MSSAQQQKAKPKEDIHHPHDKFFREAMSHPEVARDFLAPYLPEDILKIVRLDTIKQEKNSYIDETDIPHLLKINL